MFVQEFSSSIRSKRVYIYIVYVSTSTVFGMVVEVLDDHVIVAVSSLFFRGYS